VAKDMKKVEMADCIILRIKQGYKDNIISDFFEYCLQNGIIPLRGTGVVGQTIYIQNHQLEHKGKIEEYFKDRGIEIGKITIGT